MLKIDITEKKTKSGKTMIFDIHKEARRLFNVEKLPDQPFECWRGDMHCLTVKSLKWAAEHVVREEPSLHFVKFVPFVNFKKAA